MSQGTTCSPIAHANEEFKVLSTREEKEIFDGFNQESR